MDVPGIRFQSSAPSSIQMNNNTHQTFHISGRLKCSPEKSKNDKTTRSTDKKFTSQRTAEIEIN